MKSLKIIILLISICLVSLSCGVRKHSVSDSGNVFVHHNSYRSQSPVYSESQLDSLANLSVDSTIIDGFNEFSINLAKITKDSCETNYIISPLGVAYNLCMFSNGARGATLTSILKVLNVADTGVTPDKLNRFCEKMYAMLNYDGSSGSASLSNSFWIDNGHEVYESFVDVCVDKYRTDLFVRPLCTINTMNEINQWVESHTNGMIDKFLQKPLDIYQRSALLNAIYMNGDWVNKFDRACTISNYRFNNEDGTNGICEMMMTYNLHLSTITSDNFNIVRFPLDSGKYGLDIVLPHKGISIKECLPSLNGELFSEWNKNSRLKSWDIVKVPKFDQEYSTSYLKPLLNLGLDNFFVTGDFSGMTPSKQFFVTNIIQKAKFKVDEEGAEAAVATMDIAVGSTLDGPKRKPTEFVLDRPFMYILTDTQTNTILFVGEIRKFGP